MLIKIAYESKYCLSTRKNEESFLTGMSVLTEGAMRNTKDIFKKENTFSQNIKKLNNYYPNYQYADITEKTVLGILCRIVGEVRRLDSLDISHPVLRLKDRLKFENKITEFQNEVVLLHTPKKEVQNNAGGIIPEKMSKHFLLSSNALSKTLLNVFEHTNQQEVLTLLEQIKNKDQTIVDKNYTKEIKASSFIVEYFLAQDNQPEVIKGLAFEDDESKLIKEISGRLVRGDKSGVEELELYMNDKKTQPDFTRKRKELKLDEIFNLWGFIFAKKIQFLNGNQYFTNELSGMLNAAKTSIKGLAPASGGITIKDFYSNFVEDKKLSWTMPYSVELNRNLFAQEDLKHFNSSAKVGVTKECGELIINLDLSQEEEMDLYSRIESSGVNTFHLGKKGLAYINEIVLESI